jgi:DMSO/TMAO reductase YedYZ molybdopterin-dependent catalytic subunit
MRKNENIIFVVLLLLIVALVIIAVFFYRPDSVPQSIKNLSSVEVREYKGEDLSSIAAFRENSIKGPQYVNISNYKLEIYGLTNNPINYSYDEVLAKQNYEKVVTLHCVEGWDVTILWKGVFVRDLLDDAKPKNTANTVILYAVDGYSTQYPLQYFYDNDIIIAYEMNNVTIPPERGYPFMLVAEDKWGYKWIKWINKIELSNDTNYNGYWESRGYAKEGNLNESFFG